MLNGLRKTERGKHIKDKMAEIRQYKNFRVGCGASGFFFGMGITIFIFGLKPFNYGWIIFSLVLLFLSWFSHYVWNKGKKSKELKGGNKK